MGGQFGVWLWVLYKFHNMGSYKDCQSNEMRVQGDLGYSLLLMPNAWSTADQNTAVSLLL